MTQLQRRGGVYFVTTSVKRQLDWKSRTPQLPCLTDEDNGRIIRYQLHRWDDVMYELHAYVIMPDHLHLLIEPLPRDGEYTPLHLIMHTIKRLSSTRINNRRKKRQTVWEMESYDSLIRSPLNYLRVVEYIKRNPVNAGLTESANEWPWLFVAEGKGYPWSGYP